MLSVNALFSKLHGLEPKKRKMLVLGSLVGSFLFVLIGVVFVIANRGNITLPETGTYSIVVDKNTDEAGSCEFGTDVKAVKTCTLRGAINKANTLGTNNSVNITFESNLADSSTGVTTIQLQSQLPIISSEASVLISGNNSDPSKVVIKMN
ncbi:MAG: hypothetical protein WCJ58_00115 [bacterium]